MTTIPQLPQLKRRLQELNMQKARYGISGDPHISMEADDLSTVISQMERIDIHRRNVDTLLQQAGKLGSSALCR